MNIELKDGSKLVIEQPSTGYEIAKQIGERLAKVALVCKVDGVLTSLRETIDHDCKFEVLTWNDDEGKSAYRHTASHILAQAVKNIYPTVQLAIGPSIENGFYYDFDFKTPINQGDFEKIEAEMRAIIKADLPIERKVVSRKEAEAMLKKMKQTYKIELLSDIPEGEEISFYTQGDFIDLCAGPHLASTGKVKEFKLPHLLAHIGVAVKRTRCSHVFTAQHLTRRQSLKSISKSLKRQGCVITIVLAEILASL